LQEDQWGDCFKKKHRSLSASKNQLVRKGNKTPGEIRSPGHQETKIGVMLISGWILIQDEETLPYCHHLKFWQFTRKDWKRRDWNKRKKLKINSGIY